MQPKPINTTKLSQGITLGRKKTEGIYLYPCKSMVWAIHKPEALHPGAMGRDEAHGYSLIGWAAI